MGLHADSIALYAGAFLRWTIFLRVIVGVETFSLYVGAFLMLAIIPGQCLCENRDVKPSRSLQHPGLECSLSSVRCVIYTVTARHGGALECAWLMTEIIHPENVLDVEVHWLQHRSWPDMKCVCA